jgi:hypothetical protein
MKLRTLFLTFLVLAVAPFARSEALEPALQAKIEAKVKEITTWAADTAVVEAVRAHNASLPSDQTALTQDKWRGLTVLDPLVRSFSKNPAGQFLKSKKDDVVTEAFVSDAAGLKVAFVAKTSNWSHKGKDKHDVPMTGKTWQGPVEVDESSGQQQLQVAVPVLDGGKPIGSLVVGLSVTKLKQ